MAANNWIIIKPEPRTDTSHEWGGIIYDPTTNAGTSTSGTSRGTSNGVKFGTTGSYNKTGFTDEELMMAYLMMLDLSGGVADATFAERMGYTSPVRDYSPFVFRPGQTGVKSLVHFSENVFYYITEQGWAASPIDETGRWWSGQLVGSEDINQVSPTFGLGTPAKFGSLAYGRGNLGSSPVRTDASEDFNFGSGDFCISGWMILGSAGAPVYYDTLWNNLALNEGCWLIWQCFIDGNSPLRQNPGDFRGHSAVIESAPASNSGRLIWKFSNFTQTETYTLTHEFSEADFNDQYHCFAFARHGDVFSMYVDGVNVAHETHAITLAYDPAWYFFYYCSTYTIA